MRLQDGKDYFIVRSKQTGKAELIELADYTLAQARISDPVLTEYSLGYKNADMKGDVHFPTIETDKLSGRFPVFGREAFISYATTRALGQRVKHIETSEGYAQLSLSEHSLGFHIDRLELSEWAGSPDQLLITKQTQVEDAIALDREVQQAQLATTVGNYAAGYVYDASKAATGIDFSQVDLWQLITNAILAVQLATGRRPAVMTLSPQALLNIGFNQSILDRIKYRGDKADPADVTEQTLAALFNIKTVQTAYAVVDQGSGGGVGQATNANSFVWDGVGTTSGNIALATAGKGWGEMSFGYTYQKKGSPIVESYYKNENKTQNYDSEHFFDAMIVKNNAGFLIHGVGN